MNIGIAIKKAREAHGWNTHILGELVGSDENYISQIETGALVPMEQELETIARALGASKEVLSILGIEASDIREEKRTMAQAMLPGLHNLVLLLIKGK